MAYVDPVDGILKWQNGDVVTPQAVKENMHLDSVGTVTNALKRTGTYRVNNIPERTALVNTIGSANISSTNPLMVWRANADAGKRLEYSENGGIWHYVRTSQEDTSPTVINLPLQSGVSGVLTATVFPHFVIVGGSLTFPDILNNTARTVSIIPASVPRPTPARQLVGSGAAASNFLLNAKVHLSNALELVNRSGVTLTDAYLSIVWAY